MYHNLSMSDNGSILASSIKEGTAIAVSDGSYKHLHGTAAWVIEGSSRESKISGIVITPGGDRDQSAYRSELAGLLAIFTMVKHNEQQFHLFSGSLQISCDGGSVLDIIFFRSVFTVDTLSYDIITTIRSMLAGSPFLWD